MDEQFITQPQQSPEQPGFYQRHKRTFWGTLIAVSLAVVALMAWILFFQGGDAAAPEKPNVALEVLAADQAVSGSEISYEVRVANHSRSEITAVALELFYPRGFVFADSSPAPTESERLFSLPDIGPGGSGELVIIGTLTGSVQEIKTLTVRLRYEPKNIRIPYSAEKQARTVMLAPELDIKLSAPAQIVTGQNIDYKLELINLAGRDFSEIVVRMRFPREFDFQSDPGRSQWRIANLAAGQKSELIFSGTMSGEAGREALVQAEVLIPDSEGVLSAAGRSFVFTRIQSVPLVIWVTQKDSAATTARPGQRLSYIVSYQNNGQVGLADVVITARLIGNVFDFSNTQSNTGVLSGQSIVWSPRASTELLTLGPGEKGEFAFSLSVLSAADLAVVRPSDPRAALEISFASREFPESILAAEHILSIETVVGLSASAAELGGSRYRVEITVTNLVSDVTGAVFSAVVPGEVDLSTIEPAGESGNVQFSEVTGLFFWNMGKIFAYSGSFHEARTLSFEMTSAALPVLRDLAVTGFDGFTGRETESNTISELK